MGVRTHFRILWRNTATKEVMVQTAVDTSENKSYYRFPLPMDLSRGEYEYFVIADGGELVVDENNPRHSTIDGETVRVFDCGVAQVGRISRQADSYVAVKNYEFYGG